ncbi:MAG TPA: AAA family ATPase [Alloacidobacterium sp.]|nr:AAA family ATPase [Alloacidobacterium sp.]
MTRGFIDGEYQDGELRGITFLAGQRGMGKTTEMIRLSRQCSGGVVFFDALSSHEAALQDFTIVAQPGDAKRYLTVNQGRRFRLLYQPRMGDLDAHFQACCELVRILGWCIFAIDELDKMCGDRWGTHRMCDGLYDLVNYGRHRRVSMLATARTPVQVPRGFTSEVRQMRLFRMQENRYVKYFEEYIGYENAGRLRGLLPYQYLKWTGEGRAELCGGRKRA